MQNQKIIGTNCYNCIYISKDEEPVDQKDLNEQGGLDPKTPEEMEKAKKADLITLPGGQKLMQTMRSSVAIQKYGCL